MIDIINQLLNKGMIVVIVKGDIDTNSCAYKLFIAIFGRIAEMERERIQERVIQGVEKCKATGENKIGKWVGREEKAVEDLTKDFKKYYDKMINII